MGSDPIYEIENVLWLYILELAKVYCLQVGAVAQLARASGSQSEGRGFKYPQLHQ